MERVRVRSAYFRSKEEAIEEIVDAGWWPISWRDAPGESYEPHKHDADQALYVIEGRIELEADGTLHQLQPGDKLELPAFTVHSAKAPTGAVYIIGTPKVDLPAQHSLAPDA